jgi:hypothetical protein
MKRYSDVDVEKVIRLRKREKYSFAHLQKITGIPASTVRNWCIDETKDNKWDILRVTNDRKRREIKNSEIRNFIQIHDLSKNDAKIWLSLLYWCEGSKYPASNAVTLVNSDPLLVELFIYLLRRSFPLDESKFKVHLQIHTIQNYNHIKLFWSKFLHIPENQFIKPTITLRKGGKYRRDYVGTCTVKYQDYAIQLKLMGIYEFLANKILNHQNTK